MSEWTNAGVPNIGVDKCKNGRNVRVDKHQDGQTLEWKILEWTLLK